MDKFYCISLNSRFNGGIAIECKLSVLSQGMLNVKEIWVIRGEERRRRQKYKGQEVNDGEESRCGQWREGH